MEPAANPNAPQKSKKRGKKSPAQKATATITLRDRAAEVSASVAAPLEPLPIKAIPLSELSAIMDSHFPCEMEPQTFVNDVMIDADGYIQLCSEVYRSVIRLDPKLEESFSEPEFILCLGYCFAYRILDVQSHIQPLDIANFVDFQHAMQAMPQLPEPIVNYLQALGLYRDASGQTLAPISPFPRSDMNDHRRGMIPSTKATAYVDGNAWNHHSAMFPFGLIEREIGSNLNPLPANAAHFFDQLNPAGANAGDDAHFTTSPAFLPFFRMRRAHARRVPNLPAFPFPQRAGILQSIRWNAELFREFCLFMTRVSRVISIKPFPTSTSGNAAMTTAAEPMDGDPNNRATIYDHHAFMKLSNAEQHASRIFRFRMRRRGGPYTTEAAGADALATYNVAPANLQGNAPLLLTRARENRTMVSFYVRHYLKTM